MSDITQWSPVDANNNATPPDGYPEGMPASSVNDSSRAVMGAVRRFAEDGGWFDWGHVVTYVSGTSFQVPGDLSAIYSVSRRVRAIGTTTGTIAGTIIGTTVTANTQVDVAWDSGSLQNEALSVSTGVDTAASSAGALTGEIKAYGGAAAPNGWLLCNGASYPVATYPGLHAVIGDAYGGDGGTNFNVPDLQARVIVGVGGGRSLGDTGGAETHQLTENELPPHTHALGSNFSVDAGAAGLVPAVTLGAGLTGSTGGNVAHENMPPFGVATYIIKT